MRVGGVIFLFTLVPFCARCAVSKLVSASDSASDENQVLNQHLKVCAW